MKRVFLDDALQIDWHIYVLSRNNLVAISDYVIMLKLYMNKIASGKQARLSYSYLTLQKISSTQEM